MKAIEILFEEVDSLNSELKKATNIQDKVAIALEMQDVLRIIGRLSSHKFDYNARKNARDYL